MKDGVTDAMFNYVANKAGRICVFFCAAILSGSLIANEALSSNEAVEFLPVTTGSSSLWVMAKQFEVAGGATHWQKMVALFKKNPHAFVERNLNKLKKGVALAIPSADEVQRVTRLEAQNVYADSLTRLQNKKNKSEKGMADESLRLLAELEKTRDDIIRSTEKNTHLSDKLQALENKAQSQVDELALKNRQIESIKAQLEQLELQLGEKGKI